MNHKSLVRDKTNCLSSMANDKNQPRAQHHRSDELSASGLPQFLASPFQSKQKHCCTLGEFGRRQHRSLQRARCTGQRCRPAQITRDQNIGKWRDCPPEQTVDPPKQHARVRSIQLQFPGNSNAPVPQSPFAAPKRTIPPWRAVVSGVEDECIVRDSQLVPVCREPCQS